MTYGVHKYTSYKETPFMKDENLIYKEHKHSTANGLSGPPDNRAKISKIKSKQVKLS